jgi:hypothetical protein
LRSPEAAWRPFAPIGLRGLIRQCGQCGFGFVSLLVGRVEWVGDVTLPAPLEAGKGALLE